jgi:uncharacterized heparinase superfamily protein
MKLAAFKGAAHCAHDEAHGRTLRQYQHKAYERLSAALRSLLECI